MAHYHISHFYFRHSAQLRHGQWPRQLQCVRQCCYNVAHWNLPERRVRIDGDAILVDDDVPCRFIHFSGFDPKRPAVVSRYSKARASGDARTVFERYASMLNAAGRR